MNVLGIETSCDETSAAVVREGNVLSNIVFSQSDRHGPYGGVVPELATRCHVEALPDVLERAVRTAGLTWADVDLVAATRGPGLASSLLIGLTAARALAFRLSRPLAAVHHLEAHIHSIFLGADLPPADARFPVLVLLVSGGHTALVRVEGVGRYRLMGQTLDDAAGEALDKGAQLLGLGYPGGPAIERAAEGGDDRWIRFPRGRARRAGGELDFSFSGLKTALRYWLRDHPDALADGNVHHVAASYEEAVVDALVRRVDRALERESFSALGCAGGVARNRRLRARLARYAAAYRIPLLLAPPDYCTDNAVMVAALAGADPSTLVSPADSAVLDIDPDWPIRES